VTERNGGRFEFEAVRLEADFMADLLAGEPGTSIASARWRGACR
jgi:hypothetical protein